MFRRNNWTRRSLVQLTTERFTERLLPQKTWNAYKNAWFCLIYNLFHHNQLHSFLFKECKQFTLIDFLHLLFALMLFHNCECLFDRFLPNQIWIICFKVSHKFLVNAQDCNLFKCSSDNKVRPSVMTSFAIEPSRSQNASPKCRPNGANPS